MHIYYRDISHYQHMSIRDLLKSSDIRVSVCVKGTSGCCLCPACGPCWGQSSVSWRLCPSRSSCTRSLCRTEQTSSGGSSTAASTVRTGRFASKQVWPHSRPHLAAHLLKRFEAMISAVGLSGALTVIDSEKLWPWARVRHITHITNTTCADKEDWKAVVWQVYCSRC